MFKKILLGLALALVALIAVVAMQPSAYHVERSIEISAPADVVWKEVSDFNQWPEWNPWQKSDPRQTVTIAGTPGAVGHSSRWDGETSGKGSMTIREVEMPNRLAIDLKFDEPMSSEAGTTFTIAPSGPNVQVTWAMDGENDFVGKFFGLVMGVTDMVGSAYEQGLADLKKIAEANASK